MKSNSPFWHNECAKREKIKVRGRERKAQSAGRKAHSVKKQLGSAAVKTKTQSAERKNSYEVLRQK